MFPWHFKFAWDALWRRRPLARDSIVISPYVGKRHKHHTSGTRRFRHRAVVSSLDSRVRVVLTSRTTGLYRFFKHYGLVACVCLSQWCRHNKTLNGCNKSWQTRVYDRLVLARRTNVNGTALAGRCTRGGNDLRNSGEGGGVVESIAADEAADARTLW